VTHTSLIALGLFLATSLVAGFFAYVYSLKRQAYQLLWMAAWCVYALHYLLHSLRAASGTGPVLAIFAEWFLALAGLLFFVGARLLAQRSALIGRVALAGLAALLWSYGHEQWGFPVSSGVACALTFFATSVVFFQESRRQETLAEKLLGITFGGWAILHLALILGQQRGELLETGVWALSAIPAGLVAIIMMMALYEEEKRRVERNMLALSSLNLATSTFVGGEIQRMLAQALDRVLGVIRLPSGALFLHHGDPHGPASVVAVGLGDDFCAVAQEERIDDHLVQLVSRLGGLVVFRELSKDAVWASLEKEDAFRHFRRLALEQGLRTVVCISLQAKGQGFGVLLLGTPDNRRFTAGELRLLMALGHQIGMAVENSYLIQQTSRRTEELHVLNEIGRALSSTLQKEELLPKISEELRRLFDVDNFFIATMTPHQDEVSFELEIVDGVKLAKRKRSAGNHLVEYIQRTRQPVLVREDYAASVRNLGVEPLRQAGCFCGVPLVAYDRVVGVMAVHHDQERLFDEGHLELLRVLASEASIAIENARLFHDERTKARHLTLLNAISRHAIATLNPAEMLAKIAEELETGLLYDHVGIGVLEYSTREVVVEAEAGKRRGALGMRIPLGSSLAGHVARTGQMAFYRAGNSPETALKPLLADTAAAVALPVSYADHLHGILYVELTEDAEFSEEEILLLRTLADLLASAMHNALAFQKAQEQAITDGLTGVKTHRYFMEVLSGEWKKATRAARSFSLVLMDLDRFKFVNDFYGHLEGDLVLQRVGHILEENSRRSDVVARYGGDEFVILMPETTMEQARQVALKLRGWICADALLRKKNVTASFGIACYPLHGSSPQELIQVADASMYLSKHQGGNTVSTADHVDPGEAKKWKRDVLEAYLGVTLKRMFATGPEAFEEIYERLKQFTESLTPVEGESGAAAAPEERPMALPQPVLDTVTSLAYAIDAKDHYTQGHSQKVSAYAALIAEAMGMGTMEVEEIRLAGILHDIGKVAIPETILNKSGPLNPEEWETMKSHVTFGAKILEPLTPLGRIREMVRHHHEYFDGSGYPNALVGEKIPLGARIIAVADSYDTITSERSYKKPRTAQEGLAELERCANAQFDGAIVTLFVQAMRQLPNPLIEPTSLFSTRESQ